jgi:type II secretory pathway component PulF
MDLHTILIIVVIAPVPAAYLILWLSNLFFARRRVNPARWQSWVAVFVWTLTLFVVVAALTVYISVLSGVAGLAFLFVVRMAFARNRWQEQRALLWCLSTAAEKGLPLEQAATAFAADRSDLIGYRARRLATYLQSGIPLPEATALARIAQPTDALLALRVGQEIGNLPAAVTLITRADTDVDLAVRAVFEKLIYLFTIATILVLVVVFMMLKIVPVFSKMFDEFGILLPAITRLVIATSNVAVNYWFLGFPFIAILVLLVFGGFLYYLGWLPRDLPILNRLALRTDASLVMRSLGLAVRQGISLQQMIGVLSRVYPRSSIRARLGVAAAKIESGADWCDSLRDENLLRSIDVAVLKSAERAGNLAWALDEMADSTLRRIGYRMRLWLNVCFPVVLLVFGLIVAFHVIGLFIPLVSLIQALS